MKILRVVSSGYEEGGVETGIVLLQPLLESQGHEVRILSSDSHPELRHFNHYSFKKPHGLLGKFAHTFNLDSYRTVKKILKDFKPDVVHLHTIGYASPSILFALKYTPTVATVHGPEGYTKSLLLWCLPPTDFIGGTYDYADLTTVGTLRYWYYRYLNYPIFKIGLKNVDVFVTLSRYMQKLMHEEGILNEYVPNGTILLEQKPLALGSSRSLLYAGRLEKFKGVSVLIEAMSAIAAEYPASHLYIAGEGRDKTELVARVQLLGLEQHVTFLGHISQEDLAAYYERAAMIILPSLWPEAFGKVGIEAMSVGRPVIASDVGGISDWLRSGETGFLVPPNNSKAIADAVVKLFSDPELYKKFSARAREVAEQFDLRRHAQKMVELYAKVVSQKNMATRPASSQERAQGLGRARRQIRDL